MKVEIDAENIEAIDEICKQSNRTPSDIVNSFVRSLYDTWRTTSGRFWFGDAHFGQVLDCILNNLSVGPKIIEDTTKGFLIENHLKSKIDQLEVDFEKVRFWYTLENNENKHDLIKIKVNIERDKISLSRNSAIPIPTTAVMDLHKRIREATQLSNELIQDKYSSNKLAPIDVKLSVISADMVPYFVAI